MKRTRYRRAIWALPLLGFLSVPSATGAPQTPPAAAGESVDIELVLVTDVSYSVDENEARFQREGAITAFRNADVVKAIQAGALGRIAVSYIDFVSAGQERILVNWQIVHDKASADAFADALARVPRTLGVQTSISSGIALASRMIETSGFQATEKVIDVSGDGPNNDGLRVDRLRDETVAKGVTINGLPIVTEADKFDVYYLPDLDKYYAGCVIGGPNAFYQVAHGFEDLARAIRRKLILEISDSRPNRDLLIRKVAAVPQPSRPAIYERGCDIGERMRFGGAWDVVPRPQPR